MLRALTRAFSAPKEQLKLAWYLMATPPLQKTLVLTGPHGTGKSTQLQLYTQSYQTQPLSNFLLTIPFFPKKNPQEDTSAKQESSEKEQEVVHPIRAALTATTDFLYQLEETTLTDQMYIGVQDALSTCLKQLSWKLEEPLPLPEDEYDAKQATEEHQSILNQFLTASNATLAESKIPLRVSALSEQDLAPIIKDCPPSISFQILALGVMASGREEGPGELLAPLIISIANAVGKEMITINPGILPMLVVLESMQHACMDQAGLRFLTYFLQSILKSQEHFHCVLEGNTIISEPFKLITDNPDRFIWTQVFEFTRTDFDDYIASRKVNLSVEDKESLWKLTKGTQGMVEQILDEVEDGFTMTQIQEEYINRLTAKLDEKLAKQGMPEVPSSATIPHIQKMELMELRAITHFLSHIVLGDDEVELSHADFYNNGVAQHLCLLRFCYYNPETKRLRIENALLREAIMRTNMWRILNTPTQQFANKSCYQKALEIGSLED